MKFKWLGVALLFFLISIVAAGGVAAADARSPSEEKGSAPFFLVTVLTGGFAMAIGSAAAALAQGKAVAAALDGIARQPSAAGRIQTAMIIGLAMIESLAIYVLLIVLILFFANPFLKFVVP
jgi:F-type H+-transporting ATPase subunit c